MKVGPQQNFAQKLPRIYIVEPCVLSSRVSHSCGRKIFNFVALNRFIESPPPPFFPRLRRSLFAASSFAFTAPPPKLHYARLQYRQLRYTILVANMHPPRMDFVLTKRPEMEREQVYMKINLAPCLDNPYPDYLQEVFSAPTNSWALVPHFIWDNYVYSSKIWSAVPKMVQT